MTSIVTGGREGAVRNEVALCLAGGGYPGALFEFGAVHALSTGLSAWRADRAPVIVGTSAGAVVGAVLAMGVDPREIRVALEGGKHPLEFRRGDFSRIPWRRHGAGGLRLLMALPRLVLRQLGQGGGDLLEDIRPLLPLGVFTNAGLVDFLERAARTVGEPRRFEDLRAPLVVTATDLDGGDRAVFGTGWDDSPPVALAVRASSAIPVYFEPVRIGRRDLIDGQIVDPLHLDLACVESTRAVIAINPLVSFRPDGSGKRVRDLGAPAVMDQSGRIAAGVKLRASQERFQREHPEVPCFFVEPGSSEVDELLRTGFNARSLTRAWELGFRCATRMLRDRGDRLAELPIEGLSTPDLDAVAREGARWGVAI